jgi:hypothetical protein
MIGATAFKVDKQSSNRQHEDQDAKKGKPIIKETMFVRLCSKKCLLEIRKSSHPFSGFSSKNPFYTPLSYSIGRSFLITK